MPRIDGAAGDYFETVVASSPDCIRIVDLQGRIEFMNPAGRALLKIDDFEASHRGRYWPDQWPQDTRDMVAAALRAAAAGESRSFRASCARADGTLRWLDTTVAPVFGGRDRSIHRVLAISRDVTSQLEARGLLQTILECVPAALFVKDLDTSRYVFVNTSAEQLFGRPAEEMIGKSAYDYLPRDEADAIRADDVRTAAMEAVYLIDEEAVTRRPGEVQYLRTRKKATPPGAGARYLVCLTEDITAERERAEALQRALREAQAGVQAKNDFLAVMGHEIRTPLNAVLGMAQAMAAGELSALQGERLDVIREAGGVLLDLLNDLLDLSRITAGGLELEDAVIDAAELGRAAKSLFDGLASTKDISFEFDMAEARCGRWAGDPVRVRQIVTNLVGNAVKFTDRGQVALRIRDAAPGLSIEVADTGPGVAPDKLGRIFEPFDQLDASITRRHGGSGLGLAICQSMARLMGGDIDISSQLGVGSTFLVTLPLTALAASADETTMQQRRPKTVSRDSEPLQVKILAAEDNPMNQLVLKALLGAAGVRPQPHIVSTGVEALEAWRRESWDLILMDVQMPVLDGRGATRQIRAEEKRHGAAHTPIIGLTANAMQHQAQSYLADGMDGIVAKPIDVEALLAAIRIHARGPVASRPSRGQQRASRRG